MRIANKMFRSYMFSLSGSQAKRETDCLIAVLQKEKQPRRNDGIR